MKTLTDRQKEVLIFIAQFTEDNTYPPTVREIAEHFSVSIRAIQDHINALNKKGYILLTKKRSRSMKVLKDIRENKDMPRVTKIPLLKGTVAGNPDSLAKENEEEFLYYAAPFIDPAEEYVAVRIQDESLKDRGIFSGDIAILTKTKAQETPLSPEQDAAPQNQIENDAFHGKLVAVVIDDAVVVRGYQREDSRVCLQPANADFQPLYSQEVKVLGVLAGIVRAY